MHKKAPRETSHQSTLAVHASTPTQIKGKTRATDCNNNNLLQQTIAAIPTKVATISKTAAPTTAVACASRTRTATTTSTRPSPNQHCAAATHLLRWCPLPAPLAPHPPAAVPATPRLAVPLEGEGVAALPGGAGRGTDEVVRAVALLAEAAVLAAGGRETAALPVLHHRLGDPLDARVVADGRVGRVHGDNLSTEQEQNKRRWGGVHSIVGYAYQLSTRQERNNMVTYSLFLLVCLPAARRVIHLVYVPSPVITLFLHGDNSQPLTLSNCSARTCCG